MILKKKAKKSPPKQHKKRSGLKSMPEERTNEQTKLADKPGKKSSEKFKPGDKVIIQETTGRRNNG